MEERKLLEIDQDELWAGHFCSLNGGQSVYYKCLRPEGKVKLKILFLHNFYDYHEPYIEMGKRIKEILCFPTEIIWLDFKGFGLSGGTRGHVQDIDELYADTELLIKQMKKDSPHIPLMSIGQGLGGVVALKLIETHSKLIPLIDFCALLNPLLSFRNVFFESKKLLFMRSFPNLKKMLLPKKIDFHKICTDESKINRLKSDPLMRSRISFGLFTELSRASSNLRKISYYIDRPALFLSSSDDFFNDQEQLNTFIKGIPSDLATSRHYLGAKHDLANDKNREMMFNDVCKWIFLQMEGRL